MAERGNRYQKKPRSVSLYFLLWSAFSAFALLIVLLFTISNSVLLKRSSKAEVAKNLAVNGASIQRELLAFRGTDYSKLVLYQSSRYDLGVCVLDGEGTVIFPHSDGDGDGAFATPDFTEKIVRLKNALAAAGEGKTVLYEDESGEYVYGTALSANDGQTLYLYVYKSLNLSEKMISEMTVQTGLLAIFVVVLSFVVSGAISGVLSRPLTEMTEKAKLLARGDFSVDFRGRAYGSEMQLLAATLNYAREELSKADQLQKELIANISHDFKTPLTMIKAYASMISEISGGDPVKREKHTKVIIEETDRLTSLVNDILDLSKLRSGINTLKIEEFDLSEYTFAVIEKFSYLAETQGYVFETEVEDGLYTAADSVKIGQVLYNLIGNAVNYTGEDKRVKIVLKREGEVIRFAVSDTGKGIEPEEIATIWDRYYRSSSAHKRPVQGTGLGLSIVKTILEKHGFAFGVESAVGAGSTFYVLFPNR